MIPSVCFSRYFAQGWKRNSMLEANNLQGSLLPLMYMSIPFGVAPRLPTWSKALKSLSTVFQLFAVGIVMNVIVFITEDSEKIVNDKFRSLLLNISMKVANWIGVLYLLASVATHIPHRSNITFSNIIESLARIDECLKMDKACYTMTKRVLCTVMIGIPVLFLACSLWSFYR